MQQNLLKTMHQGLELDRLDNNILQFVLEQPYTANILSQLAEKIGSLLEADICLVVATKNSSQQKNGVGCWQEDSHSIETNTLQEISQKLSALPLASLNCDRATTIMEAKNLPPLISGCLNASEKDWLGGIIQHQEQTNGLILLLKSSFSPGMNSESKLLAQNLNSIAIAISQIQLQQQAQTQARYQALLRNISQEISQSSHPQSLSKTCLSRLCETLGADRGLILMLKYKNPLRAKHRQQQQVKGTARVTSCWNAREVEESPTQVSFNLQDSELCQKAWHSAPSYLAFNTNAAFPDLSPTPQNISKAGSALLMMPLMGKKSSHSDPAAVLGFLVLQHHGDRSWSTDELDLIDWVRVQLSTALVNYQTLTQVQSIVEERTSKLQWSLDVQAKLASRMRQQIDQLQKLNILKDDFMSSMSHELKTPLTSMKMAIMMLRQASISPEMREKYLDILEQEWNREYDLIKDLLTLQSMESGELNYTPEELELAPKIADLAESFAEKWYTEKGIKLEIAIAEQNLKINTDIESLESILKELLLNAAKYSDENTTIVLSVASQTTMAGKSIIISVTNQGAEITAGELPHIFDKFRRGKGVTDRAVPGTGLGLALVQHLVEHLNGTIKVTNQPGDETLSAYLTTFVLELPQFQLSMG